MTAIFISHSSADNLAAAEMKRWLEAQGHTSLFLDFDPEAGIKGGSGWEQTLYQRLRQCQAVIALLTPNWLASKWCFAELVQARERGKAIFPVKVQPCEAGGVFGDIQHLDLTTQPEEGYKRLKIGLLERGLDPLDVFDWDPKRPPYPGLMAFQEADAAIFFGRGEDILKTLETLDALRRQGREAARFALLLGASGSGKSSLARAGVIPRLKKRPAEWLPTPPFRPQVEPLDELAMALAAAFDAQGKPRDWSAICTELHTAAARNPVDGQTLLKLARDLAIAARQPETTMLLTIDQAEELFGYTPSESATRFLRLLRAALEAADRQLMVVATLRSDFLGQFQNHAVLQDSEYPHHFAYRAVPVDPMPLRSFPEIIHGPARLAGLQLGDGLVPNGRMLASASSDSTVIWDVVSRKPLGRPLQGALKSVAFSPDGKTLASASRDSTVILWDVASRKPLGEPFKGHQEPVSSVAFSPDGKTLASASWDKTVILWDVDVASWMHKACSIANRNLTHREWAAQYVGEDVPYQAPCPELPVPKD